MIYRNLGDGIEGEKIVFEAGFIRLGRKIVRSQGHHGDRAVGSVRAFAYIAKAYSR